MSYRDEIPEPLCSVCHTPLSASDEGGFVHWLDGHEDHTPVYGTPKLDELMRGEGMWPGLTQDVLMERIVDTEILAEAIKIIRERHPEINESTKPSGARVVVHFLEREIRAIKNQPPPVPEDRGPWPWERQNG